MRPYLVFSFRYRTASSGPKVLHRLCHLLNAAGQRAFVSSPVTNPRWDTPVHGGPIDEDWIVVYPEIVVGNPLGARHVARWVLNHPGKLGGETSYDPSEVVFYFHEAFNDLGLPPERRLNVNAIELDVYTDRHLPRRGALIWIGHGQMTRPVPGRLITRRMRAESDTLALSLNRAEVLYSFDPESAMNALARLCGCRVVLPAGTEMEGPAESGAYRAWYLDSIAGETTEVARFVEVTQALA